MFDGEDRVPEWAEAKYRKTSVVQVIATVATCVMSIATLLFH